MQNGQSKYLSFGMAALLLAGCASAPKFRPGEAILKGETPVFPPAPDSLRCELELTAFADGRKSSVSAAFSAKPVLAYKLDLFGLPGMVAWSFLWSRGSQGEPAKWTLVLFDREEYGEGEGEHVEIGNLGLREISVHDVFSFLWGDFFPGAIPMAAPATIASDSAVKVPGVPRVQGVPEGFTPVAGSPGVFTYPGRDAHWRVTLDARTGVVREALRADSAFRITYDDFRTGTTKGGSAKAVAAGALRVVPRKVRLYRYREQILEIRVKSLEDDPKWRRDPFFIKVPKGFRRA